MASAEEVDAAIAEIYRKEDAVDALFASGEITPEAYRAEILGLMSDRQDIERVQYSKLGTKSPASAIDLLKDGLKMKQSNHEKAAQLVLATPVSEKRPESSGPATAEEPKEKRSQPLAATEQQAKTATTSDQQDPFVQTPVRTASSPLTYRHTASASSTSTGAAAASHSPASDSTGRQKRETDSARRQQKEMGSAKRQQKYIAVVEQKTQLETRIDGLMIEDELKTERE